MKSNEGHKGRKQKLKTLKKQKEKRVSLGFFAVNVILPERGV